MPFVGRWLAAWHALAWLGLGRFGVAVAVPGHGGWADAMTSAPTSGCTT